jgi:hypothetical protein
VPLAEAVAHAIEACRDQAQRVVRLGRQLRSAIGTDTEATAAPALPSPVTSPDALTAIECARFPVSPLPTGTPGGGAAPVADLPAAYGYDRVVLLVRDPWSAFAYWEVTPATRADATRRLGTGHDPGQTILRLYQHAAAGTPAPPLVWTDLDVPAGVESWQVRLPHPAGSFFVEIGVRTFGGQFVAYARSAVVDAPPTSPSPDGTVTWVTPGGTPAIAAPPSPPGGSAR